MVANIQTIAFQGVEAVPLSQMIDDEKGESSAAIADRVARAQEAQLARQDCLNARL